MQFYLLKAEVKKFSAALLMMLVRTNRPHEVYVLQGTSYKSLRGFHTCTEAYKLPAHGVHF